MAMVRIPVDGYSLLSNRPELAPGKPRRAASGRIELAQSPNDIRHRNRRERTGYYRGCWSRSL
jgi:hypothetical protein